MMSETESPLNQFIQQLARRLSNKSADEIKNNLVEIFCRDCTFPMFVSPKTEFPTINEMRQIWNRENPNESRDLNSPEVLNIGGSDNPFPLDAQIAAFFGGSDTPFPLGPSVFALLICSNKDVNDPISKEEIKQIVSVVKSLHRAGIPVGAVSWGFENGNA